MDSLAFVYQPLFDRTADGVLTDEDLTEIESELMHDPRVGEIIQHTGGARKMRAAVAGRGKRGGARVIYVYVEVGETVHFLLCYPKNVQGDLTSNQKKALRQIIGAIKKEYQ